MQAAAQLQRQLRQQDFELYSPNPRMLPAKHHPRKLLADILPEPPAVEQLQSGSKRCAPAKARAAAVKRQKATGTQDTRMVLGAAEAHPSSLDWVGHAS